VNALSGLVLSREKLTLDVQKNFKHGQRKANRLVNMGDNKWKYNFTVRIGNQQSNKRQKKPKMS
jgi:hypothetical protein